MKYQLRDINSLPNQQRRHPDEEEVDGSSPSRPTLFVQLAGSFVDRSAASQDHLSFVCHQDQLALGDRDQTLGTHSGILSMV